MKLQKIMHILILVFSQVVHASPYSVGDKLLILSLYDQYDKAGYINKQTKVILFSRDKVGGNLLNSALSQLPDNYLSKHNIVFISDISQMPSLISKYMAIPSMRKKNYSILLDHDGSNTKKFPDRIDTATLINIESLQIKNIVHLSSIGDIKQTLKLK